MNKRKSGRFAEIMTGKGFYVILFLCIAAIGVSGYMLFFQGAAQTEKQAPLDYEEPADVWRYPDAEDYLDAEAALDRAVKPEIPVGPSPGQGGGG
ncbi:MAG: hypothetical protein FWH06_08030, partial [Oscillospiraceae bacterium]|nr:hypothetical protein [Oscillospiraceae bacterium]